MNPAGHFIWYALTGACVIWYSTITVYVAVKGVLDIQSMLRRLREEQGRNAGPV